MQDLIYYQKLSCLRIQFFYLIGVLLMAVNCDVPFVCVAYYVCLLILHTLLVLSFLFWDSCRYYLSLVHVASLFPGMFCIKAASTFSDSCSTAILRSTNVVLAILCGIILYEIIKHLRPALDDRKAMLYAVILVIYPLHWFFTFLYYTDVASLTAVLATYLACLKKNYLFSGLVMKLAKFIQSII